jgi:hypothetical protein
VLSVIVNVQLAILLHQPVLHVIKLQVSPICIKAHARHLAQLIQQLQELIIARHVILFVKHAMDLQLSVLLANHIENSIHYLILALRPVKKISKFTMLLQVNV